MTSFRVRFAPSPTGPLHIGGIRTALYNYLLAKKYNGCFILRIEDTDQTRYLSGAEKYIIESLKWFGIIPQEGPEIGGDYGPYRQSERKKLYQKFVEELISKGHAYFAFDTPEELDQMRETLKANGVNSPKYDQSIRMEMKNSLTISGTELEDYIRNSPYKTVRMKVPENQVIIFQDRIRGEIEFKSDELDDKIILKSDGMPTYHMANIVDDHLMEISHVIRGEEWLSSTAHHVLLYRALDWEIPVYAHLPLILKPTGKGKLSKRDGAKFGFPVFPIQWENVHDEAHFTGFREEGFLPEAVLNFLAFLGWNPGTEQEIFTLDELCESFNIEQIGKSGARFDIDKARWYNQQYIIHKDLDLLTKQIVPIIEQAGYHAEYNFIKTFCHLMRERVETLNEFVVNGYFFFENPKHYDQKTIRKKYKTGNRIHFRAINSKLYSLADYSKGPIEQIVKGYIQENNLKFGEILPILRIAISGTMKGPDIFEMIALIGKNNIQKRIESALIHFEKIVEET